MLQILTVTKSDIKTNKIGDHINVALSDTMHLNFTRDALDELIADYEAIKKSDNPKNENDDQTEKLLRGEAVYLDQYGKK